MNISNRKHMVRSADMLWLAWTWLCEQQQTGYIYLQWKQKSITAHCNSLFLSVLWRNQSKVLHIFLTHWLWISPPIISTCHVSQQDTPYSSHLLNNLWKNPPLRLRNVFRSASSWASRFAIGLLLSGRLNPRVIAVRVSSTLASGPNGLRVISRRSL